MVRACRTTLCEFVAAPPGLAARGAHRRCPRDVLDVSDVPFKAPPPKAPADVAGHGVGVGAGQALPAPAGFKAPPEARPASGSGDAVVAARGARYVLD
eukprot:7318867-Pyramimonas_sp.AAC.1